MTNIEKKFGFERSKKIVSILSVDLLKQEIEPQDEDEEDTITEE